MLNWEDEGLIRRLSREQKKSPLMKKRRFVLSSSNEKKVDKSEDGKEKHSGKFLHKISCYSFESDTFVYLIYFCSVHLFH